LFPPLHATVVDSSAQTCSKDRCARTSAPLVTSSALARPRARVRVARGPAVRRSVQSVRTIRLSALTPCSAMLCYAMLCYAMLCYAMLCDLRCYAMQHGVDIICCAITCMQSPQHFFQPPFRYWRTQPRMLLSAVHSLQVSCDAIARCGRRVASSLKPVNRANSIALRCGPGQPTLRRRSPICSA
jgi:hypothetical protein